MNLAEARGVDYICRVWKVFFSASIILTGKWDNKQLPTELMKGLLEQVCIKQDLVSFFFLTECNTISYLIAISIILLHLS